jgi:peptidylprolyl isomerase
MKKTLFILTILSFALIGANHYGDLSAMENTVVVLETTQGNIELTLMPDVAPKACENFVKLIEKGYYDGIIFHRVIPEFMIQGGDPTGTGSGGSSVWGKAFSDEVRSDVGFDRAGILAMANSGPNTNGSQFFITTAETSWLNMRHTIFGKVTSGYETVKKIENVPTGLGDKPKIEQKIIKAYVKKSQ